MSKKKNFSIDETKNPVIKTPNSNASRESDFEFNNYAAKKKHYDLKWCAIGGVGVLALAAGGVLVNHFLAPSRTDSEQIAGTINTDNGDQKINWNKYGEYEVVLTETYTITKPGTYHLTGEIADGAVIIRVTNGPVKLILDNAKIKNSSGPAIACFLADDLVIELVGESTLEDGTSYSSDYDGDVRGAIYSKADLTFEGEGTLNLTANLEDGIVSKDDLKFNGGNYKIAAKDDAIRGKDSVYIVSGNFNITAGGDAIKSTNETDTGKGFVLIEDGTFKIKATAKGIKAINTILVYDGSFTLDTTDDAIHSNSYISVNGGNYQIASGDDGIHADRELIINGGEINITKSYEGIEAQKVVVNDGKISVVSSDDGFNAGGGADSSSTGRPGANAFDANEDCVLIFNGGEIYVNSSGDGLDSNGMVYINGGNISVDGPTNNGNGALDSGLSFEMTGGTVVAVGASGMAETLGANSTIYNTSIFFSSTQAAGTKLTIKDSSGSTIISHIAKKTFSHAAIGTSAFESGKTYTIYLNNTEYATFTISNITTVVGNSNANFGGGMMNGGMMNGGMMNGGRPSDEPSEMQNGSRPNGAMGGRR